MNKSKNKKKYDIGIALSGGGARGFAHLGIMKALYEKDIYPDVIAGVSAGAIVGAFLADGQDPEDIFSKLKDKGVFNFTKLNIPQQGLLRLDGLKDELKKEIQVDNIEDLKIPFFAGISNLNTGKIEYHNKGPIDVLVLASSSIPVLFAPVIYNDQVYVDGGLIKNIPVDPLKEICKKIIAININPLKEENDLDKLSDIAARTFQISVNSNVKGIEDECDIYIEPEELSNFDILDAKKAIETFDIGYHYTKKLSF